MNVNIFNRVEKLIEELAKHETRLTKLRHELIRSLAIVKLWPEAFDHGGVTSKVGGSWDTGYEIRLSNLKHSRLFDLHDVPECLWPEEIRSGAARLRGSSLTFARRKKA